MKGKIGKSQEKYNILCIIEKENEKENEKTNENERMMAKQIA